MHWRRCVARQLDTYTMYIDLIPFLSWAFRQRKWRLNEKLAHIQIRLQDRGQTVDPSHQPKLLRSAQEYSERAREPCRSLPHLIIKVAFERASTISKSSPLYSLVPFTNIVSVNEYVNVKALPRGVDCLKVRVFPRRPVPRQVNKDIRGPHRRTNGW